MTAEIIPTPLVLLTSSPVSLFAIRTSHHPCPILPYDSASFPQSTTTAYTR